MKTILFKVALVAASALFLAGCGADEDSQSTRTVESSISESSIRYFVRSYSTEIYSISIEGHEYIVFEGAYKGNIIHSGGCPCMEGTASRNERAQDQFDSSTDR